MSKSRWGLPVDARVAIDRLAFALALHGDRRWPFLTRWKKEWYRGEAQDLLGDVLRDLSPETVEHWPFGPLEGEAGRPQS